MSRQNSMDVSSLEVTINGSQVGIEPIGNGTKPFDDVKVMLVKGLDGVKSPYTSTPNMDGVGSAGSSDLYARGDHVHPSDQSKVNVAGDVMFGDLSVIGQRYPATETKSSATVTKIEVEYDSTGTFYYRLYNGSTTPSIIGTEHGAYDTACYSVYDSTGNIILDRAYLTKGESKTFTFASATDVKTSLLFVAFSTVGEDVSDSRGNVLKDKLEPATVKPYAFEISASNWSSSQNASGYYTYTLSLGTLHYDTDVTPVIMGCGSDGVPTEDEAEAYDHIVYPNGYVEHYNVNTFKLYAKEKPENDFWIKIYGVSELLPY